MSFFEIIDNLYFTGVLATCRFEIVISGESSAMNSGKYV